MGGNVTADIFFTHRCHFSTKLAFTSFKNILTKACLQFFKNILKLITPETNTVKQHIFARALISQIQEIFLPHEN